MKPSLEVFDPVAAFVAAVHAGDAPATAELLRTHPELRDRIDDPLPGFHFGGTALLAALPTGNRELIDVLLEAGADINRKSHWWAGGFGVLDGDHGLDEFLIERGAYVDVHAAARLGDLARLERLVAGAPELVHARGGDGRLPLHVAANAQVADWLLDHGADIDARDVDHESTAVQWQVRERQDVARRLVERGARADLLLLAALGEVDRIRRDLDADPEAVEITVSERDFPMRGARAGGTIYIWTLGRHRSPHAVAHEFGHAAAFDLLMQRSRDALRIAVACEVGDRAAMDRLLAERPGVIETLTADDRRRLAHVAQCGATGSVQMMLDAGWPVDVPGEGGTTALHWAAFHGNVALVALLLERGASLEAKDAHYGGAPLGWAIHGSVHGVTERSDHVAVVRELLDAGATISEYGDAGSTAVRTVLEDQRRR